MQRLQKILARTAAPKVPEWQSYGNFRKVTQYPHFLKKYKGGDQSLIFGRFLKNFPWSPVLFFQKMRVLNDLAKIPITWPFGNFWSRCLNQNILPSLHFKCVLEENAICASVLLGLSNEGSFWGDFSKNFPWSPLRTFSENAGFGWPCENCLNLAVRPLLEPFLCHKIFSSLCPLSAY